MLDQRSVHPNPRSGESCNQERLCRVGKGSLWIQLARRGRPEVIQVPPPPEPYLRPRGGPAPALDDCGAGSPGTGATPPDRPRRGRRQRAPGEPPGHPAGSAAADAVRAAAAKWGADPNQLLRVASCESGLNPNSYNSGSGATGLFQFKPGTFYAHGGHNIWDAADQADVAAHMFSQGLANEWSCK